MTELKRTPLYAVQAENGGKFVPFAGWEMPVQFSGLMAEHQAVRTQVGLFDVSHMGEIIIEGPQAFDAVQFLITNDVAKLSDGKALYTVMCVENGGIVDDLIVYRENTQRFFICVNASRRADDFAHMRAVCKRFDCTVTDVSDEYAQLALQGPHAAALLAELVDASVQAKVAAMEAFSWLDAPVAGLSWVRIARTGYTGEHGYELYARSSEGDALWRAIMRVGDKHGLLLCGLGCRDTLRLEMKYPLYGNDIDLEHNPLEAGLGWVVKFAKGDFVGKAALEAVKAQGVARKWVGFKMLDRGIPRHGYPIAVDGQEVGVVTSGTHSPSLGEPIGTGYVPAHLAALGSRFDVVIRNKAVLAEVVKTPFLVREK